MQLPWLPQKVHAVEQLDGDEKTHQHKEDLAKQVLEYAANGEMLTGTEGDEFIQALIQEIDDGSPRNLAQKNLLQEVLAANAANAAGEDSEGNLNIITPATLAAAPDTRSHLQGNLADQAAQEEKPAKKTAKEKKETA
eukprot:CAMPEP_0170476934 /NCGR_PEP_ID=MMETSP0123-20130129/18293_1 /TAXON_ID=182087 /ORGANISM="Favella ehrenbergii, Strain Fehren 1" /LENGTH=137 /DNA_ID=CAMNT_0010748357 /DNA_START=253 /DNA_END=667 /DNA_ORIENTATION=+